jgi:conjugal transfer/entry exclusion protein
MSLFITLLCYPINSAGLDQTLCSCLSNNNRTNANSVARELGQYRDELGEMDVQLQMLDNQARALMGDPYESYDSLEAKRNAVSYFYLSYRRSSLWMV